MAATGHRLLSAMEAQVTQDSTEPLKTKQPDSVHLEEHSSTQQYNILAHPTSNDSTLSVKTSQAPKICSSSRLVVTRTTMVHS